MEDMHTVLDDAPWNYRTDLVAVKSAYSPADLTPDFITHSNLWLELHNVPLVVVSMHEAQLIVAEAVYPIFEVREGFMVGRRFLRVKVNLHSLSAS